MAPRCAQEAPRGFQDGPKRPPNGPQEAAKRHHKPTKRTPSGPRRPPRSTQDAQEHPNGRHGAPKTPEGASKRLLRDIREAFKMLLDYVAGPRPPPSSPPLPPPPPPRPPPPPPQHFTHYPRAPPSQHSPHCPPSRPSPPCSPSSSSPFRRRRFLLHPPLLESHQPSGRRWFRGAPSSTPHCPNSVR
eukprot:9474785-Pyramimonas_sp.AAC.1